MLGLSCWSTGTIFAEVEPNQNRFNLLPDPTEPSPEPADMLYNWPQEGAVWSESAVLRFWKFRNRQDGCSRTAEEEQLLFIRFGNFLLSSDDSAGSVLIQMLSSKNLLGERYRFRSTFHPSETKLISTLLRFRFCVRGNRSLQVLIMERFWSKSLHNNIRTVGFGLTQQIRTRTTEKQLKCFICQNQNRTLVSV